MDHNRFLSKAQQYGYYVLTGCIVLGVASFMVLCILHNEVGYFGMDGTDLRFVYRDIPIMMLSGVFGVLPATISFALALLNSFIFDFSGSYQQFVCLVALLQAYLASRHGRFKSFLSSMLSGFWLVLTLGGVWYIVDLVASAEGLYKLTLLDFVYSMAMVAPEVFFFTIVMHLFHRFVPDKYKRFFLMGAFYMKEDDDAIQEIRERMGSKISVKMTAVVFANAAVIGISAAVFAAMLMPDVADKVLSNTASDNVAFYDFERFQERREQWEKEFGSRVQEDAAEDAEVSDDAGNTASDAVGDAALDATENAANTSGVAEEAANTTAEASTGISITEDAQNTVRFVLNNAGIAFTLKIVLMIINISVPFVILADTLMQNTIARPITLMAHTVQGFSSASHEEQKEKLLEMEKVSIRGNDEIAELYDSIAQMATEINEFVDTTIREQKLEEDLRVAKISSENKSNFLNNVSHELRTPINAVLGLDEMILRETKEEGTRQYAQDIQNSGKTLLGLVNDILDSSKLESGKMEILPVEYELGSVINDVVNMIAVKAREKNLALNLHVNPHIPHILFGDEIRLKQIMVNILTNAVKYTEEGSVDFSLGFEKQDEEHILLECSIKDTGIGIKQEDMQKLFSRFERIDEGRNRTIEGTGLGMNIVKQLLALMDSELMVESIYGAGSTFSFRVKQKVVNWDEMGDYEESYRRSQENVAYRESFHAPEALILVTDDTPMNLTVIKALLKSTQVQVETAESGFETLDMVQKKKYDVIFLDHRMPKMDGIETLQKMKELAGNLNADTPVISLTANAVSGARETYMAAGFVDYLSKPIDSIKLENMLRDYLPKEKLHFDIEEVDIAQDGPGEGDAVGDSGGSGVSGDSGVPGEEAGTEGLLLALRQDGLLDVEEAVKNCGGEEVFLTVLGDYLDAVDTKAGDIERYWQEGDYKNYTVLVHALKSSSRLVGAKELSEEARHLEELGNLAEENDENARKEIDEKTPNVLKLYRSVYERVSPLLTSPADEEEKPVMDAAELKEAMAAFREFVEAFDFDSADSVMAMINEYQMPENCQAQMDEIKRQLAAVDQAALLDALNGLDL